MDTIPNRNESSWWVTEVVDGPVADVARRIEQTLSARPTLELDSGRLDVRLPREVPEVAKLGGRRTHDGRLRYSRWRLPIGVAVEIESWSFGSSSISIRPTRRPPGDVYFPAALAAVDALVADAGLLALTPTTASVVHAGPQRWRRAS